jgi:hypothetical protein
MRAARNRCGPRTTAAPRSDYWRRQFSRSNECAARFGQAGMRFNGALRAARFHPQSRMLDSLHYEPGWCWTTRPTKFIDSLIRLDATLGFSTTKCLSFRADGRRVISGTYTY